MKKFLIATNLLTLGIMFLQGCFFNKTNSIDPKKTICSDYSKDPFVGLDKELVENMIWNYKWNHLPRVNMWVTQPNSFAVNDWDALRKKTDAESDARCIMFDIDSLKKFLWQLEYTSIKNGLDREKLGVRIYYCEYPDSLPIQHNTIAQNTSYRDKTWGSFEDLGKLPTTYQRRHTLIFVPTYTNAANQPVDFDPRYVVNNIPVPLTDVYSEKNTIPNGIYERTAFVFPTYARTVSSTPPAGTYLNHGSLVPPPAAAPSGASLLTIVDR